MHLDIGAGVRQQPVPRIGVPHEGLDLLFTPQALGPLLALCALAALPMAIRAIRGRKTEAETS